MPRVEIIVFQTEAEYRDEYYRVYVNADLFLFGEISVLFSKRDFDHIFFEPSSDGQYSFSERRARRLLYMKALLSDEFTVETFYEIYRGTLALFCRDLECVMYLRNRPGANCLQVGSFFDFGKDHTKMYEKQKKKCEPITLPEVKQKFGITPEGEEAVILGPTTP